MPPRARFAPPSRRRTSDARKKKIEPKQSKKVDVTWPSGQALKKKARPGMPASAGLHHGRRRHFLVRSGGDSATVSGQDLGFRIEFEKLQERRKQRERPGSLGHQRSCTCITWLQLRVCPACAPTHDDAWAGNGRRAQIRHTPSERLHRPKTILDRHIQMWNKGNA